MTQPSLAPAPAGSHRADAPIVSTEVDNYCSSGVLCLAAIAHAADFELSPEPLHRRYALGRSEPSADFLVRIAEENGFKAKRETGNWETLLGLRNLFPLIARTKDGHWLVLAGIHDPSPQDQGSGISQHQSGTRSDGVLRGRIGVLDPQSAQARVVELDQAEFLALWNGEIVIARKRYALHDEALPFGFRWFLREILQQKSAFRDVAATSIILSYLGLASPIFTQLVIDKVLLHQSHATLLVLIIGIGFAILFETAFSYLRQYLVIGATNKIDMRLTRKAFTHMMSLPINYFEQTSAGVVLRNMYQLESIRGFFTGSLFSVALECVSLVIFAPLLFMYSAPLALVVISFSAAMAIVVIALIKPYNSRLKKLFAAEGKRQSIMVEAIHGMRTVKALAIEPAKIREWNERSANSIMTSFNVMKISIGAQAVTHLLERASFIAVIGLGAISIFDGGMTVGALIAFQMISGRVTGPLVQIVGLVHQYQEVSLSVEMLGEIMNHPPEGKTEGTGLRPDLRGAIRLENVTFRYPGAPNPSLIDVSLDIKPGQVIGIVGRSGSGKTTLTRLIQSMYRVTDGVVRIDGVDIREIDLGHLRSSIGVVLQENFMFRGTVRENIAASRPNATLREVIAAAQAAGADEFIERLPQGYDTMLEENAANLSGGQKQRLSIARAILPQPKLLILDEAASALDPESEAIFIQNLSRIARGKTVLMVSHRLSTLVRSDAIMVFDKGRISDVGKHQELLQRCDPYQVLWRQQMGQV